MSAAAPFSLNDAQVRQILPHRPPMLLVDRVIECDPALQKLKALKQISAGDAMLPWPARGCSVFACTLIVEALAQTCGLLMNLRWLAAKGFDVAAFAAEGGSATREMHIPHSVLAETRMSHKRMAYVGDTLELAAQVQLQRGSTVAFGAEASNARGVVMQISVVLAYPQYTAH